MVDGSIGMMDKAYFVGKGVIIQWVNELLSVSLPSFALLVVVACAKD